MFTGIIQHVGIVQSLRRTSGPATLTTDLGPLADGLVHGESVATNGVCLTVTEITGSVSRFDIMPETLSQTALIGLKSGDPVNLERAMQLGGGLDGHMVQGHVDGIATVRRIEKGDSFRMEFTADRKLTEEMVNRGSVAINGVSLTLVNVGDDSFSVSLIPTTLDETNLHYLTAGDKVNIETDMIGKYVLKFLRQMSGQTGGLTLDKLRNAGFA